MEIGRRWLLKGLGALIAAPALVKASSLMQLRGDKLIVAPRNLLTIEMITREAVELFKNSNKFLEALERDCGDPALWEQSGSKIGSTLRVRLPSDYVHTADATGVDVLYGTLSREKTAAIGNAVFDGMNNSFQYDKARRTLVPNVSFSAPEVAMAVGAAALVKNPVVSRRFWSSAK